MLSPACRRSVRIEPGLPGFRTNWIPGQITLAQNGCAFARVHSVVRTRLGPPVSGVLVELLPLHPVRNVGLIRFWFTYPDVTQAIPVAFTTAASVQSYDLTVPANLRIISVHARIVGPDGHPPLNSPAIRVKELSPARVGARSHDRRIRMKLRRLTVQLFLGLAVPPIFCLRRRVQCPPDVLNSAVACSRRPGCYKKKPFSRTRTAMSVSSSITRS